MAGLDFDLAVQEVWDYVAANLPTGYELVEGDMVDAKDRAMSNGVAQPMWFFQSTDLYSVGGGRSFGGPWYDDYYTIFRIYSLADTAQRARKAQSIINRLLLGKSFVNVGTLEKDYGGGAYTITQANSKPIAFLANASFRGNTNISNVGSAVYP